MDEIVKGKLSLEDERPRDNDSSGDDVIEDKQSSRVARSGKKAFVVSKAEDTSKGNMDS